MKNIRRLRLEAFILRSVEGQLVLMDDPDLRLLTVTHIELSNDQLKTCENLGEVSASMMFGTTRFNAWASARNFKSGAEMAEAREAMLKYFCDQYRMMLEEIIVKW